MSRFKKATREARNARVALDGPSGSGKTYTALSLARFLGKRVAVIDTEHSSASTYAPPRGQQPDAARGWFDFEALPLESHAPQDYIDALHEAAREGFDVVIVDSLSHAWMGKGGILQQVDERGGKFEAWKFMAPQQQALMEALLTYPGHVIVTLRTKTSYDVSKDDKGKTKVEKTGTAPVQKDGMEYEFDVVIDLDTDNTGHVSKTRCTEIAGMAFPKPGEKLGRILRAWCETGGAAEPAPAPPGPTAPRALRSAESPPEARTATKPPPTPKILHDELVAKFPSVAAEAGAVLAWDRGDADKMAELRAIHGRAKLGVTGPRPDPVLVAEATKLVAAAELDDPEPRERVRALLAAESRGSGRVEDIEPSALAKFIAQANAVINSAVAAA